jgi:hypothetical protein
MSEETECDGTTNPPRRSRDKNDVFLGRCRFRNEPFLKEYRLDLEIDPIEEVLRTAETFVPPKLAKAGCGRIVDPIEIPFTLGPDEWLGQNPVFV